MNTVVAPLSTLPARDIMGIAVTAATAAEAIAHLDLRLADGGRIKLAYLNAHTSNVAASDADFAAILGGFTVLNDGAGVDLASLYLYGQRFPENLNGTDFTTRYLAETSHTFRIFLLGAHPGVAEEAARAIAQRAPQHVIAGTQHGYFTADQAHAVAAAIAASKADMVLAALGNPAQEHFIATHFESMDCRIAIGVGALFDFLTGRVSRAPKWVRAMRAEWVYRLLREPRRLWRRYLVGNCRFVWRLLSTRTARSRDLAPETGATGTGGQVVGGEETADLGKTGRARKDSNLRPSD
jgi:exopolysaccharide biosynthesis WecB/TagA/CpsF family protein